MADTAAPACAAAFARPITTTAAAQPLRIGSRLSIARSRGDSGGVKPPAEMPTATALTSAAANVSTLNWISSQCASHDAVAASDTATVGHPMLVPATQEARSSHHVPSSADSSIAARKTRPAMPTVAMVSSKSLWTRSGTVSNPSRRRSSRVDRLERRAVTDSGPVPNRRFSRSRIPDHAARQRKMRTTAVSVEGRARSPESAIDRSDTHAASDAPAIPATRAATKATRFRRVGAVAIANNAAVRTIAIANASRGPRARRITRAIVWHVRRSPAAATWAGWRRGRRRHAIPNQASVNGHTAMR